jgi:glycine cleavage system H protein
VQKKEHGLDLIEPRYSPEHIWVRLDDDNQATIGISEEALENEDEISRIKLPTEGDTIAKDEAFGRITTAGRNVIRLYCPVSGEVVEVNDDILDAPEMILEDPYEEGWLVRLEISNIAEYDDLMTRDEYDDFLGDVIPDDDEDEIDEELDDEDLEDEEDL